MKAVAVTAHGVVAASTAATYPTLRPAPGAAEQEPRAWRAAARDAMAALASEAIRIEAIAVTGQMHGTALLGENGDALAPAIIWSDQRGAADAAALNAEDNGRLIAIAGSPAASGFQAATMRWLRRAEPRLWAATKRVALPKDALISWLCGELVTDPSDAAGTWLLDSARQRWSMDLCAAAGVESGQLPAIRRPGTIAGELRSEVAAECGLPAAIPVVIGGGDAPCAALGAGIVDPSEALIMLSTGAQVLQPATSYDPPADGLHQWPAALPGTGHWNRMGATLNAGVAIDWVKRLLGADDIERLAAAEPGSQPPLFLPYLTGERDPVIGADARAAFLGLTAAHGPADLAHAVLEGIAFSLVPVFDRVCGTATGPARVSIAGGGARLPSLVRLIATALNMPLTTAPNADLTALGAAMLGGHALGWLTLPGDAHAWSTPGHTVEPDATMRATLQTRLAIARDLNSAIQPALKRLGMAGFDRSNGGAGIR